MSICPPLKRIPVSLYTVSFIFFGDPSLRSIFYSVSNIRETVIFFTVSFIFFFLFELSKTLFLFAKSLLSSTLVLRTVSFIFRTESSGSGLPTNCYIYYRTLSFSYGNRSLPLSPSSL